MKGFIFLMIALFFLLCQFFVTRVPYLQSLNVLSFERHIYCKSVLLFRFYIIKFYFDDGFKVDLFILVGSILRLVILLNVFFSKPFHN